MLLKCDTYFTILFLEVFATVLRLILKWFLRTSQHKCWGVPDNDTIGNGITCKERRQNYIQYNDNNMMENIGNLFVKCMRQLIKGHLSHLSDCYVMYRQRARSVM